MDARPEASDPGAQLMLAYQAGSEEAFDELVRQYSGQVYALVTRFVGSSADSEDLVQETFLRVVRSRERYVPTAKFSTWLYRIVFNLCVSRSERSARRERTADELDPDEAAGSARADGDPRASDPAVRAERADVVRAVRGAVAALPETQRVALILAKYHELPYAEIAEVLGSSEKAVKSMIHRARENLRERLAPFLQRSLS